MYHADLIRDNPVWAALRKLTFTLDSIEANQNLDPESRSVLQRARTVAAFVDSRLAGTAVDLLRASVLTDLSVHFASVTSEIEALGATSNPQNAVSATAYIDAVVSLVHQISNPTSSDEVGRFRQESERYFATLETLSQKARDNVASLDTSTQDLRNQFDAFASELASARSANSQLATDLQRQFDEINKARGQEYLDFQQFFLKRIDSIIADQQSQFSAAQEARSGEFISTQTARQNRFEDLVAKYNDSLQSREASHEREAQRVATDADSRIASLHESFASQAKLILGSIEEHKQQVEKLVGVIGDLGVTSGYLKTANSARRSMWLWQVLTLGAMALLIWFAFDAFLPVSKGDFKWESFAGRVVLTITVGVLAAYTASQADKFFQAERRNRQLALELEALRPFLSGLPPEKQDEIRSEVGRKTFGQIDESAAVTLNKSPATITDLLKPSTLAELVSSAIAAIKKP